MDTYHFFNHFTPRNIRRRLSGIQTDDRAEIHVSKSPESTLKCIVVHYQPPIFGIQVNLRARKFPSVSCFRRTLGEYRQGGCRLQQWCTSFLWGHVLYTAKYVKRPQNGQNNRYRGKKDPLKHPLLSLDQTQG